MQLAKNLSDIYLASNDEGVLQNCALSMTYLMRGDHSRVMDAELQLKRVAQELQSRIMDLAGDEGEEAVVSGSKRRRRGSSAGSPPRKKKRSPSAPDGEEMDLEKDEKTVEKEDGSEEVDRETALYLNLKRLRVLMKRCDLSQFFGGDKEQSDNNEYEDENSGIETLSLVMADGLRCRLNSWKVSEETDETNRDDASLWKVGNKKVPPIVAGSVHEGVLFYSYDSFMPPECCLTSV